MSNLFRLSGQDRYFCSLLVSLIAAEREQKQLVPDQVEIRLLNSFSVIVCLKLLGREFHTLGTVYLLIAFQRRLCPMEVILDSGSF